MSEIEEQGASVEDRGELIEKELEEEEAPSESRSLPPIVKLLILVVSVVGMVAGAYFLTKLVILPQVKDTQIAERLTSVRERIQQSREEREEEERERGPVITHSIDDIIANIEGGILMLDITVVTRSEDALDEMIERDYQIRDALLFYFRGRTLREISTTGFMPIARDTIRSIINSIVEDEPVDTVFFTDYIIG